jgi:hypothetical protein
MKVKLKVILRPTVSRPVSLRVRPPSEIPEKFFFAFSLKPVLRKMWVVHEERLLWRDDGSVVYSYSWASPAKSSSDPNPLDWWPNFIVSNMRLPQPGWPRSCIYFPMEQGSLVISPGIEFLSPLVSFLVVGSLVMTAAPCYIALVKQQRKRCFHYCVFEKTCLQRCRLPTAVAMFAVNNILCTL